LGSGDRGNHAAMHCAAESWVMMVYQMSDALFDSYTLPLPRFAARQPFSLPISFLPHSGGKMVIPMIVHARIHTVPAFRQGYELRRSDRRCRAGILDEVNCATHTQT
jgi:hypothetical protein